jgi:sugar/nucleoside kinase (ribokinase family)
VPVDLIVATPAFLDLTVVGLDALPVLGEERFAGDLVRSPGGGAITAWAAARLGLSAALVAPIGTDLPGEFVRTELEREGVLVQGSGTARTPQTLVLPCGDARAMVTVDPGARARSADVEAVMPAASVSANLEQIHLLPEGVRVYLTCGNDDAQAFAGRLPADLGRASALFLDAEDAPLLTGTDSPDAAIDALGAAIATVVITRGSQPAIAILDGERLDCAGFDVGPAVDPTGDRDLMAAAYAWADLRGADPATAVSWARLYSELGMTVPTATGGAVTEAQLLEEGLKRELEPPPRAQRR